VPRLLPHGRLRSRLYRSFSWPLAKRLAAELEVTVSGGSRLAVRTDDSIGRVLAISGVWEPNVSAVFSRRLARGDVCVDIGAHIGYFTLLASRRVGPQGHVYAFEPSPTNFRALRSNVERNDAANVTALQVAVGPTPQRALLVEGPGTNTGRATLSPVLVARASAGRPEATVEVRPVTADLPAVDLERIRVVKIDVEGYELEVLKSLEAVFELSRPLTVFIELTPGWTGDDDPAAYVDDLRSRHGFDLEKLETGYSVGELFPNRLTEPLPLSSVPSEQCDLVLTRR
jgi:FkbM family methyltransferase